MTGSTDEKYQPIENYGIIGNLHTTALISLHASIDFMSFTRFDSPTLFCKLLDADKGGSFSIAPQMQDMVAKQLYLPDTNILVSRFLAEDGIAEIIDYMPVIEDESKCVIVRRISTVRGKINYRAVCAPRFNYAKDTHELRKEDHGFIFTPNGGTQLPVRLLSNVELVAEGKDVASNFTLAEGENAFFILEADQNNKRSQDIGEFVTTTYQQTINFWQNWIAKSTYKGKWRDIVNRSALILKLLVSCRYGSMVASPTFGLPESIGHSRNWDYRYTWIRDAAFSLHAFLQLGFKEEAAAFLAWIKKQSTDKELQLMFAIDGETNLTETELNHLEGYKGSKPVRIGNNAHKQLQMDIYGELLETIYIFTLHEGDITYDYWKIITQYIDVVIQNWKNPDHSIWEVRGDRRQFLFSAVMCWVAMDRAIKIANKHSFPYDIVKWHASRDEIYRDIHENFWDREKETFVQFKGGNNVDSSLLIMPILSVVSPHLYQWQKTMEAIDRELRSDVLLYRYKEKLDEIDGLDGQEGTFTMCSFWHVECLALAGDIENAREHFEKMLGYANHLGLFSEQLGKKGEFLGNFPQAFTHLALISAAIQVDRTQKVHSNEPPTFGKKMK